MNGSERRIPSLVKFCAHAARFRWRAPPESQPFAPHFTAVRHANADLRETLVEMEARFLGVSTTIEETTVTGRELVKLGEALSALAIGPGGGQVCIGGAAEHIWRSVDFVDRSIQETDSLIEKLSSIHARLNQVMVAERALGRTLAPLTYVQALFRVESVRLIPEVRSMFQALVVDIERVRQNVENEFRDKFELIHEIQLILTSAIDQLRARSLQAKHSVQDVRTRLTESLERMQISYARNQDRDTRLSNVSQAVSTATGRVVTSLQFYDTFTQKLQHTQKILTEMEERASSTPRDRKERGETLLFIREAGLVCGAQIDAMTPELLAAGTTVNAGIQEIIKQMAVLDADCVALRDLDSVTTGGDGAVQILLDSITEVNRLVVAAATFAKESHSTIEPIGGKTTNFTHFIHNLAFEIQLIGLNAEIQSTHVGKGTGLEVLSAQTSSISRETSEVSTNLAVDLDTLTSSLREIVGSFQIIREQSDRFEADLAREAVTDTKNLHDYRDRSVKVLMQIGELLPKLQAETKSALAQSDFVSIASKPLQRLQSSVADVTTAAETAAKASATTSAAAGALTDHFFKYYTMSAEGDVHRKALGLAPTTPHASAAIDLFGDEGSAQATGDVELFGFDDPPQVPTGLPAGNPEIELWLDSPASEPSPAPEGECKSSAKAD